jgi:hypothetical protein
MRAIQQTIHEGILDRGILVVQRTRQLPDHRIEHHRRQLPRRGRNHQANIFIDTALDQR